MNTGELKTKLRNTSHRTDLDSLLLSFIRAATERINRRLGTQYGYPVVDTDSNELMATHGDTMYLYGAMRELSIHIRDWEEASRFDSLFDKEISRMNIHAPQTNWDSPVPVVYSEQEIAAAEEIINGT